MQSALSWWLPSGSQANPVSAGPAHSSLAAWGSFSSPKQVSFGPESGADIQSASLNRIAIEDFGFSKGKSQQVQCNILKGYICWRQYIEEHVQMAAWSDCHLTILLYKQNSSYLRHFPTKVRSFRTSTQVWQDLHRGQMLRYQYLCKWLSTSASHQWSYAYGHRPAGRIVLKQALSMNGLVKYIEADRIAPDNYQRPFALALQIRKAGSGNQ